MILLNILKSTYEADNYNLKIHTKRQGIFGTALQYAQPSSDNTKIIENYQCENLNAEEEQALFDVTDSHNLHKTFTTLLDTGKVQPKDVMYTLGNKFPMGRTPFRYVITPSYFERDQQQQTTLRFELLTPYPLNKNDDQDKAISVTQSRIELTGSKENPFEKYFIESISCEMHSDHNLQGKFTYRCLDYTNGSFVQNHEPESFESDELYIAFNKDKKNVEHIKFKNAIPAKDFNKISKELAHMQAHGTEIYKQGINANLRLRDSLLFTLE